MASTVISFDMAVAATDVASFDASPEKATLEANLKSQLWCLEPACFLELRAKEATAGRRMTDVRRLASTSCISVEVILTIPDTAPDGSQATAADIALTVEAAATTLASAPAALLASRLGVEATPDVTSIATAANVNVALVVAPPPPSSPPALPPPLRLLPPQPPPTPPPPTLPLSPSPSPSVLPPPPLTSQPWLSSNPPSPLSVSPAPPPPSALPPPPKTVEASGGGTPIAAIGGGATVAVLLIVVLVSLYLRKKRIAGPQSPIALTAINLTTTNEMDLIEGDGAAPATQGSTATIHAMYSGTRTPIGLGHSLSEHL